MNQFPGGIGNPPTLCRDDFGTVVALFGEITEHADLSQPGSQLIMHVTGNASSFAFDGVLLLQAVESVLNPVPCDVTSGAGNQSNRAQRADSQKPGRFPEVWQ